MKMMFSYFFVVSILCSTVFAQPPKHCALDDDDSSHDYLDIREETRSSALTDSNLTLVGEWPWGPCYAVAVRDSYALIGNGKLIQVMDISDPSNPTVAAEYNTGGLVRDIKLRDTLAFVCKGGGLQILNISNLFSPQEISFLNLIAAKQVIPTDSFAYVLEDPGYNPLIKVIDINDPSNPFIRSSTPTRADYTVRMALKDRVVYVSGYNFPYMTIIDARNPDSVGYYAYPFLSRYITIQDTFLFASSGTALKILTISDPLNPKEVGSIDSGYRTSAASILVQDNIVFVSKINYGIDIYDISNPYQPRLRSLYPIYSGALRAIHGDHLFTTSGGLRIINTSKLDSLYEEGYFPTGGTPNDIAIQGHYAYVATGRPGLTILDLTNPITPVRVGVLPLDRETWHIYVSDSTAYLGADSTVYVIDISSPSSPSIINTIKADTFSVGYLYENNKRLFIIHPSTQTLIYDVSNSQDPIFLGSYPLAGRELVVRDSIAYHANGTGGFVIMNVADPSNVFEISRFYPCYAKQIEIQDKYAYIASSHGLYVFNVSNPAQPESLSYISTPTSDYSTNIVLSGKYLYFASSTLSIIDISNPYLPKIVGISSIGGYEFAVFNKYIYITGDINIIIFKNELITSAPNEKSPISNEFRLYPNYPNPFNNTTIIKYSLSKSDYVIISIYDLTGRKIETLDVGYQNQGVHEYQLIVDNISAGLYLIKLTAGKSTIVKKALLIK